MAVVALGLAAMLSGCGIFGCGGAAPECGSERRDGRRDVDKTNRQGSEVWR
jgi:hypothetical protein